MATVGVGGDIEDVCARCGDTWHVVMAKLGERIAKVVCKRCGSQHNYRSANGHPSAAAGTTSAARRAPVRRRSSRTTEVVPTAPPFDPSKPPRAYSVNEAFFVGERVLHPSFGTGVVSALPGPGKVEVVFPSGARTLACTKAGSTLERPVLAQHVPIADRPPDAPHTLIPSIRRNDG